jgi:kynurenine formamidase
MPRHALLAATLLISACAQQKHQGQEPPLQGRWVDLSHDLAEDSVFWPTAEGFKHEVASYGPTPGGWFYSSYNLKLSEHGGTHLDAPIHFAEGKQTADQIPLDRLIGPAAVIDVSAASQADPDYRFTIADVENWERTNGRLPDGAIVLFKTGYSKRWPDAATYLGTAERGPDAVAKLHFPGLSAELATYLAEQRKVAAVGLDTASLDPGQSKDFMAHRILLGANIPGFENVTNLDQLPPKGATVVALPIKIRGGSGGPLRIVALVAR